MAAEIAAAAWHCDRPKPTLRATDQVFADLQLNRYQNVNDDQASGTGAAQQFIEHLERQRDWFRPFANPCRSQIVASEVAPPNSPDHDYLASIDNPSPNASRAPYRPPLPMSRIPELEEKFRSLPPGLARHQQYEAVRNSPQFERYHLTVRVLREAAKVVRVARGRPRRPPQT